MRPRVFPAEDQFMLMCMGTIQIASMRPRVFPAEDLHSGRLSVYGAAASMRPRVFPAEDARAKGALDANSKPLQ